MTIIYDTSKLRSAFKQLVLANDFINKQNHLREASGFILIPKQYYLTLNGKTPAEA